MFNPLKALFPVKTLALVAIGFLAWQAVVFVKFRPEPQSKKEQLAAEQLCARAVDRIAEKAAADEPLRIGVAHVMNDPSNRFTDRMREQLGKQPGFELCEGSPVARFMADVMDAVTEATSLEEVAFAAHNVELDAVVIGRLEDAVETNGVATVRMELAVYDLQKKQWALKESVSATSRPVSRAAAAVGGAGGQRGFWGMLWPIVLLLLLPWFCLRGMEWVVDKNSNGASALLLAVLLAIDFVLLWVWGLFHLSLWLVVLGSLVALVYNLWACAVLENKVSG